MGLGITVNAEKVQWLYFRLKYIKYCEISCIIKCLKYLIYCMNAEK